jgi:hypothetical protein
MFKNYPKAKTQQYLKIKKETRNSCYHKFSLVKLCIRRLQNCMDNILISILIFQIIYAY